MRSGSRPRRGLRPRALRWAAVPALCLGALALGPGPAGGHPPHVVEPLVVNDLGYGPSASVTILQGRSVQWRWLNSIPHSVTSAPGSAVRFDSGLHTEGDVSFVLRFDEPGTVRYFSKGSPRISGQIEVLPLPGVGPRIRGLDVGGNSRPVARFGLNKGVYLVARVEQRTGRGWQLRDANSFSAKRGTNRIKVTRRRLAEGRYRLKLSAYDNYRRRDADRIRFRVR